jgi:hypothetical protein
VAEDYKWLCENLDSRQWHWTWIPITHDSWNQCGVEAGSEETGLVMDGSFPDPARRVAPWLTAVLHATCEILEAGIPFRPDEHSGPKYESWRASRDAVVRATCTYEQYGPWMAMTVHAHALLRELDKALNQDPRLDLLDGPAMQMIDREERITFRWLDRDRGSTTVTAVRTNACDGLTSEEAVEKIVNGLFSDPRPRNLFADRPLPP